MNKVFFTIEDFQNSSGDFVNPALAHQLANQKLYRMARMHEHLWIFIDFDGGYIEVCEICGYPRSN